MSSCTITANTSGVNTSGGTTHFQNTALQNDGYLNCSGDPSIDDGNNFSSDDSCTLSSSTSTNGGVDAKLGPLTLDPVHLTYYRSPLAGSPLIDAGASCPALDQLEASRNGVCDIGSVEFGQ